MNVLSILSRIDGYLMSLQKRLTSQSSASSVSCSLWFSAICGNEWNYVIKAKLYTQHTTIGDDVVDSKATLSSVLSHWLPSFLFFNLLFFSFFQNVAFHFNLFSFSFVFQVNLWATTTTTKIKVYFILFCYCWRKMKVFLVSRFGFVFRRIISSSLDGFRIDSPLGRYRIEWQVEAIVIG